MLLVTDTRYSKPRRVIVNMAHVEAITDDEGGAVIVFHRSVRTDDDDEDWQGGGCLPVLESFDDLFRALGGGR